jgi:hypothetical protein
MVENLRLAKRSTWTSHVHVSKINLERFTKKFMRVCLFGSIILKIGYPSSCCFFVLLRAFHPNAAPFETIKQKIKIYYVML